MLILFHQEKKWFNSINLDFTDSYPKEILSDLSFQKTTAEHENFEQLGAIQKNKFQTATFKVISILHFFLYTYLIIRLLIKIFDSWKITVLDSLGSIIS